MADKELTTSFLWNACKETINVINTSMEKATENIKDPEALYNAVLTTNFKSIYKINKAYSKGRELSAKHQIIYGK